MGYRHAQHRPPRQGRHDVHRFVRRAIVHGGPLVLHHRAERLPHRPVQGRHSRRADRHEREDRHDRRRCSRTRATRPGSSARTTSAISTTCCRPTTASTSSSATSITSTPRKSRRCTTTIRRKDFPELQQEHSGRAGSIHSWATDKDDPTEQPRWGKVGKQKIEDTGPLTTKRMETCDDEFVAAAKDFIKRQNKAGKPFFVWLNITHMHLFTHTKKESLGQAGRWQSPVSRHDDRPRQERRRGARLSRRARHRRQHVRHVFDRQRPAPQFVAGRRHDAVPQREGHQLGRRVPRSDAGALARQDQGRARSRTRSSSITTGCRPSSRWPATPTSSRS